MAVHVERTALGGQCRHLVGWWSLINRGFHQCWVKDFNQYWVSRGCVTFVRIDFLGHIAWPVIARSNSQTGRCSCSAWNVSDSKVTITR